MRTDFTAKSRELAVKKTRADLSFSIHEVTYFITSRNPSVIKKNCSSFTTQTIFSMVFAIAA
jgi:hypothetical protein